MNVHLLIDAIVAQTTVLIAQLATSSGNRTPLAHTANQVFLDLVSELKRQGLGNKVIADMFGIALRTYHDKVQRLSESNTLRGHTLSTAVVEYVQERQTVSRKDVLARFSRDDDRVVRSVLRDLVDSGLLFRTGKGSQAAYKAATPADAAEMFGSQLERTANLLWVAVHRFGPITLDEIAAQLHINPADLEDALSELVVSDRVSVESVPGRPTRYRADECVLHVGNERGWEAAVFDHYQAVVSALTARLRESHSRLPEAWQGGTTYTFDVWEGHPNFDEAASFLSETRQRGGQLRRKIETFNRDHGPSTCRKFTFLSYVGQSVRDETTGDEENDRTNTTPRVVGGAAADTGMRFQDLRPHRR